MTRAGSGHRMQTGKKKTPQHKGKQYEKVLESIGFDSRNKYARFKVLDAIEI